MAEDHELSYETMVERALRGVVRETLETVAKQGLPGSHHFYITFHSHYPGVSLPDYLLERYPNDMTIVLEHQFWDLEVEEDRFSVSLSFANKPERLVVPFDALVSFADPSVQFVLQFEALAKGEEPEEAAPVMQEKHQDEGVGPAGDDTAEVVPLDSFRRK